jgi:mycothiol synthase
MQAALSAWTQQAGDCVYLHPGDIPHRLYNGMRGRFPLAEIVRLWEKAGEIIGFACAYPSWHAYDVQVHPEFRDGDVERTALQWAYQQTYHWMTQMSHHHKPVVTDVMSGDPARRDQLLLLGYHERRQTMVLAGCPLRGLLPSPQLPASFRLRSATGFDDASRLAAVHRGAFGTTWTAEQYRDEVMAKPGYESSREIVVEAPDGRLAAFCVYWIDPGNRIGYFEPVGTHQEFQRQGLARVLMYHTMYLMQQQGMQWARVMYEIDNPASSQLYLSLGFRPQCDLYQYARPPTESQILELT